jgi:O-antigen ligase
LFVSGGRGPVIAVFVSLFIVLLLVLYDTFYDIFLKKKLSKKNLKFFFYIFLLIFFGIVIISVFFEYFVTFFERISLLYELGGASAQSRVDRYKSAARIIFSFPTVLYGLGIGGFSSYYASLDDKRGEYPHNIFLEFGSELGIFGLISFVLLIYFTFIRALKNLKKSRVEKDKSNYFLNLTALALYLNMLFNSSVSGDLNDNRLLFLTISLINISGGFSCKK